MQGTGAISSSSGALLVNTHHEPELRVVCFSFLSSCELSAFHKLHLLLLCDFMCANLCVWLNLCGSHKHPNLHITSSRHMCTSQMKSVHPSMHTYMPTESLAQTVTSPFSDGTVCIRFSPTLPTSRHLRTCTLCALLLHVLQATSSAPSRMNPRTS